MRYIYSVIRFVPDPVRGEFINVGAVVGSEEASEWKVQLAENPRRARGLDDRGVLPAVSHVADDIGRRIDAYETFLESRTGTPIELSERWLQRMWEDAQNIVQFSPPAPIVASSADEALEIVFGEFVVDPEYRRFPFRKKVAAMAAVRRAYVQAGVSKDRFVEGAIVQGQHHRERFDFAVLNGQAVQLAHAWSFQIPGQEALAENIKAWAWTVQDIRKGGARVEVDHVGYAQVLPGVDVEVVYVPPHEGQSRAVLDEALSAFQDVNATAVEFTEASQVAERARACLLRSR